MDYGSFQPDILAPYLMGLCRPKIQINPNIPEHRFLLAVLEDAVAVYQKYFFARDKKGMRLFKEVKDWFLSKDMGWLTSFSRICEMFGLEPSYIRNGLLEWEKKISAESDCKENTSKRRKIVQHYAA